jgi:hypothetical protein
MDLSNLCKNLFGDRYSILSDGIDRIVVNCTMPHEIIKEIAPHIQDAFPENYNLVCGIKSCNIPGVLIVVYLLRNNPHPDHNVNVANDPRAFRYFMVDIRYMNDPKIKLKWKRFYVAWAQKYKPNIEFDIPRLMAMQNGNPEVEQEEQEI